jgi:uncharacterized protein (TIGR02452 family)
MSLRGVAEQTLGIIERGGYDASDGAFIELAADIEAAVAGTSLYTPRQLEALLFGREAVGEGAHPRIEVTGELTQEAARRLLLDEGCEDVVLLNFASAKNAGGGFINGAKAQEEDLARASALYPCLLEARGYYEANRRCDHLVYTDHMIWSPEVPFFRVHARELLDQPFLASVITAPAPNAGALNRPWPEELAGITYEDALRKRAGKVLALAEERGHRTLLLGAWGCGVFRNDPELVADAFGVWLEGPRFAGSFDRVVFAVWDRKGINTDAFARRFARNRAA